MISDTFDVTHEERVIGFVKYFFVVVIMSSSLFGSLYDIRLLHS